VDRVKKLLLVLAIIAGGAALVAWPRVSDVESGRSPEYPELQVREYAADEARAAKAVKDVMSRTPGWTWLGSGRGPAGSGVTARHQTGPVPLLTEEVTVKIQRQAGRTRISVRSRSLWGPFDLGQNARNIRSLVAELDRELR
jgi:hypothetical protein